MVNIYISKYIYIYGPFIDGLPMKNGDFLYIYIYGWWFQPTPLKNDGVSSSVGMIFHSQLFLET